MQAKSISKERKRAMRSAYIKNNWQMYLMVLVPIAFVIIFKCRSLRRSSRTRISSGP